MSYGPVGGEGGGVVVPPPVRGVVGVPLPPSDVPPPDVAGVVTRRIVAATVRGPSRPIRSRSYAPRAADSVTRRCPAPGATRTVTPSTVRERTRDRMPPCQISKAALPSESVPSRTTRLVSSRCPPVRSRTSESASPDRVGADAAEHERRRGGQPERADPPRVDASTGAGVETGDGPVDADHDDRGGRGRGADDRHGLPGDRDEPRHPLGRAGAEHGDPADPGERREEPAGRG